MKKFVSVLLVVAMTFALVACSGSSDKKSSKHRNKSKEEKTENEDEKEAETEARTRVYTVDDARAVLETYYSLMVYEQDFDTYYKLCYPEHLRAGRSETYAKYEGVDPADFDLEAYARNSYEENFDIIQNIISDPSYEVFGCVVGGSEEEALAALDQYYHDDIYGTGSRDLEQWRQTAIDNTKGFTGGNPDNIQQIFLFASRCTNYRELLVVYAYNGELYIGSQIDWQIGH